LIKRIARILLQADRTDPLGKGTNTTLRINRSLKM
jgi:hypothetical protein